MTEKMIRDAYVRIRTIDQTIPDDVLDFMRDASIEKLNEVNKNFVQADVSGNEANLKENKKDGEVALPNKFVKYCFLCEENTVHRIIYACNVCDKNL